jgi:hypothetical protein
MMPVPSVRARVKAECDALEALMDRWLSRVKHHEHPPFRIGAVCWG